MASNLVYLRKVYLTVFHRANFFLGIDASYGYTKIPYGLSVDMVGHNRTSIHHSRIPDLKCSNTDTGTGRWTLMNQDRTFHFYLLEAMI